MIVVFVIVLVVFGPQKLPELARGLGKLMAEFRKASTDFKSAFEEEMRDLERQAREVERRKAELLAQANSALQAQPATQGTPSGTETEPPAAQLAQQSPGTASDFGATEATPPDGPVLAPVAESTFARGADTETSAGLAESAVSDGTKLEPTESHDSGELKVKAQRAATDD